MSALNDTLAAARMPLLVVSIHELREHLRNIEAGDPQHDVAYTDMYSWRKTDLALSVDAGVSASRLVLSTNVHALCGWAVAEPTGTAAAAIRLHDGNNANGEQFARINLQANESVRDTFVPHGIRCFTGRIFCEVLSGQVEGVLYWR